MANLNTLLVVALVVILPLSHADIFNRIHANHATRNFSIDPRTNTFLKDGKLFQYISGSMHYFRIPKEYWFDRLKKAKAAGLDAIQLYIPWNFHEWEEGNFNFAGDRDVELFIQMIAKLDMLAIVRAGPYICAEWSFGGLPPWLMRKNPLLRVRSSDPEYYNHVRNWFQVLLPKLRPLLYENGGPIIMVQLENEYGMFSVCDKEYMSKLYDLARHHLGPRIILFTTDGNSERYLQCGSPDERYLATVDFGPSSQSPENLFNAVEQFRPNQPLINSEFYTGWFDQWNRKHSHTETRDILSTLKRLMNYSERVNVNLYVFHGGTNFGFWNGNSGDGPVLTSYDFDAPINEAGDLTEKFIAIRNFIHEFKNIEPPPMPSNLSKMAYGTVQMQLTGHILNNLVRINETLFPINMEAFNQYDGFMVYSTELPKFMENQPTITFERFADIAYIYTGSDDTEPMYWHARINGPYAEATLNLSRFSNETRLVILVENTGYMDFGPNMWNNVKGIIRNVTYQGKPLRQWSVSLVLDMQGTINRTADHKTSQFPVQGAIYAGVLQIKQESEKHDTFIQPDSFGRGLIYINGRNIGRYNQKTGPQLRLFVPKPFLRVGDNAIIIVELESVQSEKPQVTFYDQPLLNA